MVARTEVISLIGLKQLDVAGDLAVGDLLVGRQNEAVLVDLGIDAKRGDETDVGAFGRLNRADSSVVRDVDVAYLEAGSLAVESAGAQCGEPSLVHKHGKWVRLVDHL